MGQRGFYSSHSSLLGVSYLPSIGQPLHSLTIHSSWEPSSQRDPCSLLSRVESPDVPYCPCQFLLLQTATWTLLRELLLEFDILFLLYSLRISMRPVVLCLLPVL